MQNHTTSKQHKNKNTPHQTNINHAQPCNTNINNINITINQTQQQHNAKPITIPINQRQQKSNQIKTKT